MTKQQPNEYLSAEQWLLERFKGETVCEGHPLHTIGKALQAGAEGRILPVLPEHFIVTSIKRFQSLYDNTWKYRADIEKLGGDLMDMHNAFAYTPAEAMQDAIDKIGGE